MAKNSIRDFDATSGNNTDIQSVDVSEGCPASGINNALRELMTDLKNVSTGAVALETPAADQLNVDNIRIDGNTISSTDTNGDISLSPSGTGDTNVDNGDFLFLEEAASSPYPEQKIKWSNDSTTANGFYVSQDTSRNGRVWHEQGVDLVFGTTNTERLRIDSSGNVGIGTSSPSSLLTSEKDFGNNSGSSAVALQIGNISTVSGQTPGTRLLFNSGNRESGAIDVNHNTAGGDNASMNFVVRDGANTMTERLRIDSSGNLLVGKTVTDFGTDGVRLTGAAASNFSASNGTPMNVNRNGDDGGLINFTQAGILEGGISVSGTTVSYVGGHISRWSQLTDGTKDTSILKGTVMTNLDQMAVWHHEAQAATYYTEDDELPDGVSVGDEKTPAVDAYDEQNEQLNCMAVSSVEGDANVAGVFVNWDNDDDDFNDMNIAMTGDMVIRIAQGTTVARGDLLMSAGDGTAKPQGDDIVRSKTIAKVTSTTVSHTYDDGSYLVPCVLMAC